VSFAVIFLQEVASAGCREELSFAAAVKDTSAPKQAPVRALGCPLLMHELTDLKAACCHQTDGKTCGQFRFRKCSSEDALTR